MPKEKNVLFISYDGMTDPLGQSQVIPYLAGLTQHGYRFTILSCDKPLQYKLYRSKVEELLAGLPIEWVSLPYHKNPPVLSGLYDYSSLKRAAIRLHKRRNFSLIHTRPGIPTLVGLSLKRKFGIKFLNDVRGFWADERVDGGMWNLRNPAYKIIYNYFKKHEQNCMDEADAITCLTHAARREMLSWPSARAERLEIDVIPCSADLMLFDPENVDAATKTRFEETLQIRPDDIVFSYLGSIGGWYMTAEMMRLCKKISVAIPAAKFLFISPHRHSDIVSAASTVGIAPEKIISYSASRAEVPVLLSFSKFSFFFIKPCYSKISSSPTKHGEIMAMGIPVITNAGVGDVAEIVERSNSGFVLPDLSDFSMDSVVSQLNSARFDKLRIRAFAQEIYSLRNAVEQYARVYARMLPSYKIPRS